MAITKEIVDYSIWGKCIHITNGREEVYVTIDFGPQIIRYGFVGKPNMFFEDVNDLQNKDLPKTGAFKNDKWHIFGGHRLWASPEAYPQTYYPAADPVEYELTENGCIVRQPVQEYTNIQTEMKIEMSDNGVSIEHKLTNKNAWPVKLAPWAISVMAQGGTEVVPQPDKDTGLLNNRLLGLWPYTKLTDERVIWGDKYIVLNQDTNVKCSFKFGLNGEKGFAAYLYEGMMFVKRHTHIDGAEYPDGGMSFETYTDAKILEVETIAPLTEIKPDGYALHTETWQLYDNITPDFSSDETIEKTIIKYI
ncbi:MAG: hypothetical protein IKC41_04270 [Clostridia bacterium]|nr:hypothetical protein [Clostridia bacterium]MBR2973413.1 hypothetical protein [Clostridia bacterium]